MALLDAVRTACAQVAARARFVHIIPDRLEALAIELGQQLPDSQIFDPAHHQMKTPDETLAFVVTLDAINFGSGWFPYLAKRPGCSGYLTLAGALRERFEQQGPLHASELQRMSAQACGELFGQSLEPPIDALMEHFAQAWRDLGAFLESRFGGDFAALVEAADGQVERMIELLTQMPMYRDEAHYEGQRIPFYKRAQITCADLALAFEGQGPGDFRDLDRLTLFADNLVPHVLRFEGVLLYAPELLERIEAEELIPAGSPEEVEMRAVAVHAVEQMVGVVGRDTQRSQSVNAQQLDALLWNRGQSPHIKAEPRHRTRSIYY